MIRDHIENIARYKGLGGNFETAIAFLETHPLRELPLGDIEIDGREVYAFAREKRLLPGQSRWESHQIYADLQLIVSGAERIDYAPGGDEPTEPYDAQRDVAFYGELPGQVNHLTSGEFVILWPGEPHQPDQPSHLADASVKLVIKLRVNPAEL